jgi:hypothetical protein
MWKTLSCLVGITILAAAAVASGAAAGPGTKPYVVRGAFITVDEAQGKARVEGGLIGDWQTTSFGPIFEGNSQFGANGTELFTGCHDRNADKKCQPLEKGTLKLSFTYWGTYDPATGALVKGQCVHPVVGGTGAFKGARGVVFMKDTPTAAGVRTDYSGTLLYAGSTPRATASRAPAALAPVGGCGG